MKLNALYTNVRFPALFWPDSAANAFAIENGVLTWVGNASQVPTAQLASFAHHDAGGAWVTPGLVDCHTHLVYAGHRAHEFASRLSGVSYEEIARAGGGIVSTVRATREASETELFDRSAPRLEALLSEGVCAIEIKSGYGLDLDTERKQLRIARKLARAYDVRVCATFLGAHVVPPEFSGRAQEYINEVCEWILPALYDEGLVDAVDVFCERIGFTLAQTQCVFDKAHTLGLPVKLHAEQLSNMEGAALASTYGAMSCDHLEHLSSAGIAAMKAAGTVAVLLPGAFYALRETVLPPVPALREANIPMAVATDHNPGTSPCLSALLTMNMACTLFRLTVDEAVLGLTRHAAHALRLESGYGAITVGTPANLVMWKVHDLAELACHFGGVPAHVTIRNGVLR
jgi:imidazolonepropionase